MNADRPHVVDMAAVTEHFRTYSDYLEGQAIDAVRRSPPGGEAPDLERLATIIGIVASRAVGEA